MIPPCPVEGLRYIDRLVEQALKWERSSDRDAFPLDITGLRHRKVLEVTLCFGNVGTFEDDHDTWFVSTRIILANDSSFPQSPGIGGLFWEKRTWIRDKSLEDSADLEDPDVIAEEIADDLQAALEQFAAIAADLRTEGTK